MNDVIVAVRMPASMLAELKVLAKKNHFLDVSEEIRSITRDKCLKYASPYNAGIRKVVDDIQKEVAVRESKKQETIVALKKLLEELENE